MRGVWRSGARGRQRPPLPPCRRLRLVPAPPWPPPPASASRCCWRPPSSWSGGSEVPPAPPRCPPCPRPGAAVTRARRCVSAEAEHGYASLRPGGKDGEAPQRRAKTRRSGGGGR